jgi:hypothetical protein
VINEPRLGGVFRREGDRRAAPPQQYFVRPTKDFLNNQTKAGVVFGTVGTGFRNDSTLFAGVDASYAGQFNFFNANRIFVAGRQSANDVLFRVPAEATPAFVTGFGVVFVDVDRAGTASALNGS